MTATTAYTDNSGEALSEEIAALNVRIDLLRDEMEGLDRLASLVSGAHEVFRARLEALERGTMHGDVLTARSFAGVDGVSIVREDGAERLEMATNARLHEIVVGGGTVIDVQAFSVNGWPMLLIGYVVPEGGERIR